MFFCVYVYFADSVLIVVSRPLTIAVTDGLSVSFDLVVSFPSVGVNRCMGRGASMNVWTKALPVGATKHPQAHLPAFSTDGADNWRAVVLIRSVSYVPCPCALLARRRGGSSGSRWGCPFSPRSETSKKSELRHAEDGLSFLGYELKAKTDTGGVKRKVPIDAINRCNQGYQIENPGRYGRSS